MKQTNSVDFYNSKCDFFFSLENVFLKKSLNSSKIAILKQRHAFDRNFVFKLAPVVLCNR